jgi:hypothetical protein
MLMRFYRGISVPRHEAEGVIATIGSGGLQPREDDWGTLANLKPRLEEIWRKSTITLADTRPEAPQRSWTYACAEEAGALFYACSHNKSGKNDTPILIVFDAEISEVIVDGRDFLYTAFQLGAPERARPVVERIFGSATLRYIDRAWATEDEERIALCDLAVQDDAVLLAHAANNIVIGGRYGTRFRSAFLVRTPVAANRIVDVRIVRSDFDLPEAEIALTDVR